MDYSDEAEGDYEVFRDACQPDGFYDDDDKQLICQHERRSPRRWFLPSPQGKHFFQSELMNYFIHQCILDYFSVNICFFHILALWKIPGLHYKHCLSVHYK